MGIIYMGEGRFPKEKGEGRGSKRARGGGDKAKRRGKGKGEVMQGDTICSRIFFLSILALLVLERGFHTNIIN